MQNINNKIVVLVGPSASGKTEIQSRLCKMPNIKRGVSSCNEARGLRDGEVDGVDYIVISDEKMDENIKNGSALEHTEYQVGDKLFRYALLRQSLSDDIPTVIVINPRGIKQLIQYEDIKERLQIYYVVASLNVRKRRYLKRENDSTETRKRLEARIEADKKDFSDFISFLKYNELNYKIVANDDAVDLDKLAEYIYNDIFEKE